MKIILQKYVLLIVMFTFISCEKKWLDAKSDKKLTVPATLTDFQGLLDNVTTMNQLYPSLGEAASDGHYILDSYYEALAKDYNSDVYIWSHTVPHITVNEWNQSYSKILVDNIILDGIKKIYPKNLTELSEWNYVKGQALFHRARVFFELTQLYAPPYTDAIKNQQFGVVLRLTSDITSPSQRSTVKQTYDQIIKDLNEAKDLLPNDRPTFLVRASKAAAYALLSRIYLSIEDYDNAFSTSNTCLDLYSSLINYQNISENANFIGRYNNEVIYHSNSASGLVSPSNWLIDPNLFNLYDLNDLRRTRFYRQNANASISFKGNYEGIVNNLFNGLATDEVYLNRAECHARAGRTSEALKDLNELLKYRYDSSFIPVVAANADDVLSKILIERKKELIFRGTRWLDLRRLNKDPRFAVTLKRTVLGVEYTLEPNSYKYTFPIPDDIIQQTGIQQNPGWP